ncbi:hypothetical protein ACOSQ3_003328 [Xanthoceras sorbifolium]
MCNEAKEKENASCLAQKILVELDKELENAQDSIKGLTIGVKKVDDMISFTRSMVTRVKSQLPPQLSCQIQRDNPASSTSHNTTRKSKQPLQAFVKDFVDYKRQKMKLSSLA